MARVRSAGRAGRREFLYRVYASTRAEELAVVPWDDARRRRSSACSSTRRTPGIASTTTGASFEVVLVDGDPPGRLYLRRGETEIRIVDIALLPEHRGNGVGERAAGRVLDEADAAGRRVTIHVARVDPALRLYQRLGFSVAEDKGVTSSSSGPPAM